MAPVSNSPCSLSGRESYTEEEINAELWSCVKTLHSRGRVWAVVEVGVVQLLVDGVKQRVGSLSTQVA